MIETTSQGKSDKFAINKTTYKNLRETYNENLEHKTNSNQTTINFDAHLCVNL